MEVHRVLVYVLQEELVRSFAVFIKLDLPILVVKIEQRVQRVVIKLVSLGCRLRDTLAKCSGNFSVGGGHGRCLPYLNE